MGLFDNIAGSALGSIAPNLLGNALKKTTGQQGTATQRPFKSHLKISDGDAAYNTAAEVYALLGAAAAGYFKIWEKTTPAQQAIRWGFGSPAYPHNQGYMWFCILDTNVDFCVGVVRLKQANARETKVFTVAEIDDSRLHGTTVTTLTTATPVNLNEMIALPEKVEFPKVGEDSMLQLWYSAITRATAEDNAEFSIPISIYQ
ncbi:hypothetical protein ACFLYS_01735 [Chloroflexota bacterium]